MMPVQFTKPAPGVYATTLKDTKGDVFVTIKKVDDLWFIYTKRNGETQAKTMGYDHTLRGAKATVQSAARLTSHAMKHGLKAAS